MELIRAPQEEFWPTEVAAESTIVEFATVRELPKRKNPTGELEAQLPQRERLQAILQRIRCTKALVGPESGFLLVSTDSTGAQDRFVRKRIDESSVN